MNDEIYLNGRWMFFTFNDELVAEYANGEEVSDRDWHALMEYLQDEIDAELGVDHYKGEREL